MLHEAFHALGIVLDPLRFCILLGGVVTGLMLGVVPGLGGVVGLAVLIPFTYKMDSYAAFALLLGMASVTTISDLIPAVLFGVPGSVGAAATVMDGHALARQGQAGRALGAGYMAALMGGLFGAALLAVSIPIVRPVVLYFGSAELLAFCIFGLSMVAVLSGRAPLKGMAGAAVGLMLAMIGSGSQTGTARWTFDSMYLWDKLPLIPLTLGLFALPELAEMAVSRSSVARVNTPDLTVRAQWAGAREALANWWLVLRCSWLGAILGTVPGLGAASIDWIAYGHAVRTEKNPERFGSGDIRGVIAAEASNNSKEGGHLIPTVAFGVPSGASMAVLLSAFLLHGLVPGPEMLTKHLDLTFSMMWSLTLAHLIGAFICLSASGLFARLALVPAGKLVPIILAVMFISAYQGSLSFGDLVSLALFGVIGWLMKANGWPRPPLMLGYVLGALFERYLFISTEIYGWKWILRPVVVVILAGAAWALYGPLKDNVRDVAATMRKAQFRSLRLNGAVAFNVAVIAVVLAAVYLSIDWPRDAKLVPQTAAAIALSFAALNLVCEIFASSASPLVSAHGHAVDANVNVASDDISPGVARLRILRQLLWLLAFLGATASVGLLLAIFLLIALQSRFEFLESWFFSMSAAIVTTLLVWATFGWLFSLTWPQSWLGDALPFLRDTFSFV